MPLKNGIVFIDNTYAREIATCSTLAFVQRVLGYQALDNDLSAAHVGNVIHAAMEAYFMPGGTVEQALDRFDSAYTEMLGLPQEPPSDAFELTAGPKPAA